MENPYAEDKWPNDGPTGRFHTRPGDNSVCYTSSELTAAHDAWNKCYAAVKAEQAEIVSDLEARLKLSLRDVSDMNDSLCTQFRRCKACHRFRDNTTRCQFCGQDPDLPIPVSRLTAIAKATGI